MEKDELLKKMREYKEKPDRNSMGCSENWYDFIYAMKMSFSIEEIQNMGEQEIKNLFKIANNIQEHLY